MQFGPHLAANLCVINSCPTDTFSLCLLVALQCTLNFLIHQLNKTINPIF